MPFGRIKDFFSKIDNGLLFFAALASAINSFFLLAATFEKLEKFSWLKFEHIYASYFFIAIIFAVLIFLIIKKTKNLLSVWKKILLAFLPTEAILLAGFYSGAYFNYILKISSGLYLIMGFFYFLFIIKGYSSFGDFFSNFRYKLGLKDFFLNYKKSEKLPLIILVAVAILHLSFGLYHITKFSAVDEPLWTDGRISKYWNNIRQGELERTNISDKPGITVALVSGIGLNWVDPRVYKIDHRDGEVLTTGANIEEMYRALRTPLFIFNFLMLFVIYALIKKLLGKEIALLTYIFIGLSPILLGISRIINPDALIWTLAVSSILSYFLYLKNSENKYLYLTGIFLGFSILTKYVANILYVYFAVLIFMDYIINFKKYSNVPVQQYLKNKLLDYFIISGLSLLVYYLFFPAAWIRAEYLLQGTIFSQAFQKVWLIFIGIFAFILADFFFLKSRIIAYIFNFFIKFRSYLEKTLILIFIFFVAAALLNVYLGMKWFDFESIVASPKTAFRENGILGLFTANFYSVIFGIAPLALLSAFYISLKRIFGISNKNNYAAFLYIILFIMFYYLASSVNLVGATVRYQIIIFPLLFIIAAIGIYELFQQEKIKKHIKMQYAYFLLIAVSAYSLYFIKPFYFSYASSLLPNQYVLNVKDMGDGSYEAAEFLNSLPDAGNIKVWSDKRGVCAFFRGACYSSFDFKASETSFDYFVISSGREARAINNLEPRIRWSESKYIRFDNLYATDEKPDFELKIGNRPNNYVKIFSAVQYEKINQ